MLTGDNNQVATHVRNQLGIDVAHGKLTQDDKLAKIQSLQINIDIVDYQLQYQATDTLAQCCLDKKKQNMVLMIGDGVNDGTALSVADIGVAMGASATSLAIASADMVLINDQLDSIPQMIKFS